MHQVSLDLASHPEPRLDFNLEPPCYAIYRIERDTLVAHQQRYSENWKTFPRVGVRGT